MQNRGASSTATLLPGTRLGRYEISGFVAAGGMGEVYRAKDPSLEREVAVKVLPPSVAADSERRARFEREARMVAALNHPNIVTIHSVEQDGDRVFITMELVKGRTLAGLIPHNGLPIEKLLSIAVPLTNAVGAAHDNGITHRDLKPANVVVSDDGAVKVLDFGIAKRHDVEASTGHAETASLATMEGRLLGTIAYMSPEQAEGKPADKRSDVFSLGSTLYEMATGRRPFSADTDIATLAAILRDAPAPIAETNPSVPKELGRIIRRAMAKDPDRRQQSAKDLRNELDDLRRELESGELAMAATQQRRRPIVWLVAAATLVSAVAATGMLMRPTDRPASDLRVSFVIPPPEGVAWGETPPEPQPAVSPDGQRVAFVGDSEDGHGVWVRDIGTTQARLVPGSTDLGGPRGGLFWSSDSTRVGYCVRNALKLHSFDGRPPEALESGCVDGFASWNDAGEILFRREDGIYRISERGGAAARVTNLDASREQAHRYPRWLPDGRRFIYTIIGPEDEGTGIFAATLDGSQTRIVPDISKSEYVAAADGTAYLVFARRNRLVAQPINRSTLAPVGDARVLAERMGIGNVALPSFSASATLLVHRSGGSSRKSVWAWVDRQGRPAGPRYGGRNDMISAALSPDESTLVYAPSATDGGGFWMVDFAGRVEQPLLEPPQAIFLPAFSRTGRRIAFAEIEVGARRLYVMDFPNGKPTRIPTSPTLGLLASDWSPDNRAVIGTDSTNRIVAVSLDSPAEPIVLVPNGSQARLSPDGRWLAYTSEVSGTPEVYVQRFPDGAHRTRVSVQGGRQAQWRGDGTELFYLTADGVLMAVRVRTHPRFEDGETTRLFREQSLRKGTTPFDHAYLPTRDGRRFLLQVPTEGPVPLTAVRNWLSPAIQD